MENNAPPQEKGYQLDIPILEGDGQNKQSFDLIIVDEDHPFTPPAWEIGGRPIPEDIFAEKDVEIVGRANAGELPCPCCGKLLCGELVVSETISGALLFCPDTSGCGFKEF